MKIIHWVLAVVLAGLVGWGIGSYADDRLTFGGLLIGIALVVGIFVGLVVYRMKTKNEKR